MFYPGWVYKNTKSNIQFIPMSCTLAPDGVAARGYLLKDKSDGSVTLTDMSITVKEKEYKQWERLYEFFPITG